MRKLKRYSEIRKDKVYTFRVLKYIITDIFGKSTCVKSTWNFLSRLYIQIFNNFSLIFTNKATVFIHLNHVQNLVLLIVQTLNLILCNTNVLIESMYIAVVQSSRGAMVGFEDELRNKTMSNGAVTLTVLQNGKGVVLRKEQLMALFSRLCR